MMGQHKQKHSEVWSFFSYENGNNAVSDICVNTKAQSEFQCHFVDIIGNGLIFTSLILIQYTTFDFTQYWIGNKISGIAHHQSV